MTAFVDSHAHLQEPEFDADREQVIQRAGEAAVVAIIVPGVDGATSEAAVALAESHPGVYAAAGYHPHEASKLTAAETRRIERLLANPRVVAVGEIGLDFYRMHSPRETQIEALEAMLELAQRQALPVIVHCRDAGAALRPLIESWSRRAAPAFAGRPLGVMHYFSGRPEEARSYAEMGFMISVHTSVTHPKAAGLREVARETPLDCLVIETDAPYGAPQAFRGRRNEPAYVIEAARAIAEVRQTSVEVVATATTANAARLFRLDLRQTSDARTGAAV